MRAILISGGHLSIVETPGKLEDLQRYVGGNVEAGFTVDSPDGKGRAITGYVDEEGLINGKTATGEFYGVEVGEFKNAFVGPVIIIGLSRGGHTVGLSETEASAISLSIPRVLQSVPLGILLRVPVIEIDTKKAQKKTKTPPTTAASPTDDSGPQGDFLG